MWKKLLLGYLALLLVAVGLWFVWQTTLAYATSGAVSAAPTPDATAAVDAANNAVSRAQDLLSVINTYAAVLGVVLTFFALLAAVLGVLGIRSLGEVRSLEEKLRDNLKHVQEEVDKTRREGDKTRSALVYLGLGDRLLNQRDTDEALENYKKAGNLLPYDAQLQYVLGRVYSNAGDYESAITTLETAHPTDPLEQSRVEKELGLAYRRRSDKGDYEIAEEHLKKAIVLNPNDSDALGILGGLYRRKGDPERAYQEYERAWRINPASSYALGNLTSLAIHLNKPREAHMYATIAEEMAKEHIKRGQSESYWGYYDLGLAQLVLHKKAEAKDTYAIAIRETPGVLPFDSVLDNLYLLQKSQPPIDGLNDIVKLIEDARK